jgi:hypothetical protein
MKGVKATEKAVAGRLRADVNGDDLQISIHQTSATREDFVWEDRLSELLLTTTTHGHRIPATAITSLGRSKGLIARLRLEETTRYPPSESRLPNLEVVLVGSRKFRDEKVGRGEASFVSWLVA